MECKRWTEKNFWKSWEASLPVRCRRAKQRHISGIMKIIYSLRYVADVRAGSTAGTGRPTSDSKDSDWYRWWKYTGRLRRVFFLRKQLWQWDRVSSSAGETMEKSNWSFYLAWQGCCYCSSGCYNYFTDTDNRSCDSVFYYSCNYSLFSFMAEEKK